MIHSPSSHTPKLMQLAITILGKKSTGFMTEILAAASTYKCNILELSLADFSCTTSAAYLLVEGSWNCLAKLENNLESLQKRLEIKIYSQHVEAAEVVAEYIPYHLEIISIDHCGLLEDMLTFLATHHIEVANINASRYPAAYTQTPLFSAKFVLLIPLNIHLLSFREELIYFCDDSNIDAVFEPIKR